MGSLLDRLEAREQAARTRVEALRAEMDRLAEHLAAEQELLGRLEITRQTVIEVLAGDAVPGQGAAGTDPDPNAGAGAAAPRVGMRVPVFSQDGDGGERRLPVAYRDVVEVLADAGPLRARQVCQAVGWELSPGIGRGCGSSSSGWSSVAGWSRPSRGCSPALGAWLRRWTAATDSGPGR
ncbi:MAG TPA: hypothetical protein VGR68_08010 [Actinomycetota bacterium]|jgi:hypothetical protein|nr:hypothetical protein [Actinomycetota bacterium]